MSRSKRCGGHPNGALTIVYFASVADESLYKECLCAQNDLVAGFRLNRDQVEISWTASRCSGRSKVRLPRKLDTSSCAYTLTHAPTGVRVYGEVPKGHYSRQQLARLRQKLLNQLLSELEQKVTAYLRLPGRSKQTEV